MHISKIETCSWPSSSFELDAARETSLSVDLFGLFVNGHDDVFRFILTVSRPFCVKPKAQPFIALFDGLLDFLQQADLHTINSDTKTEEQKNDKIDENGNAKKYMSNSAMSIKQKQQPFFAVTWIFAQLRVVATAKIILYAKANKYMYAICIHMCVSICIWCALRMHCTAQAIIEDK